MDRLGGRPFGLRGGGKCCQPFDRTWRLVPRWAAFRDVVGRLVRAAHRDVLLGFGAELADGRHRPLEHDLSRPGRPAHTRPGVVISNELLSHVAPLGWEHIALTGDYDWNAGKPTNGLRPLRDVSAAFLPPRRLACSFEQPVR